MPHKDNQQYQADMSFGFSEEDRIQPILEKQFGELTKLDKYNPFDFENEDYIIEVKSRRINHNKYNTLMFAYSKIEKLEGYEDEKIAIFVFNCDDGIYYWEQNSEECFHKKGGRFDRGRPEVQLLTNVPTEYLKKLDTLPELE